jgi:leucine dehydrogenase
MGMKAAVKEKLGLDSLKGLTVAVQGLGNVGSNLVRHLSDEGAKIKIADIDSLRVKSLFDQYKVTAVASEEIVTTECDIFAPCALGAVINDLTIGQLKCKIIAGGANNQLAEPRHGEALKELGILYAPDYVINAGGLMNVFVELEGYSSDRAFEKTKRVYDNTMKVFQLAKEQGISTQVAADRIAELRIKTIGSLKQRHQGKSSRLFTTLKEVNNR